MSLSYAAIESITNGSIDIYQVFAGRDTLPCEGDLQALSDMFNDIAADKNFHDDDFVEICELLFDQIVESA